MDKTQTDVIAGSQLKSNEKVWIAPDGKAYPVLHRATPWHGRAKHDAAKDEYVSVIIRETPQEQAWMPSYQETRKLSQDEITALVQDIASRPKRK